MKQICILPFGIISSASGMLRQEKVTASTGEWDYFKITYEMKIVM